MKRKAVELPDYIARLLRGAGVELSPEKAMGVLFGAIAHLLVSVQEQWPEAWATFQGAAYNAIDELRLIVSSDSPRDAMDRVVKRQREAGRETIEKAQQRDAN